MIRAEFGAGRLSYAKVRALTRIATPGERRGAGGDRRADDREPAGAVRPRSEPSDSTQSSSKRPGCRELVKTCTRRFRGNVRCLRTCALTSYTKVRSPLAIAGQSCAARIPGPRPCGPSTAGPPPGRCAWIESEGVAGDDLSLEPQGRRRPRTTGCRHWSRASSGVGPAFHLGEPEPPLRSYLELGALPTAVPCARLHARHVLWEWGLNGLARAERGGAGTTVRSDK